MIDFSAVRSIPPKTKGNRGFLPSKKVMGGVAEYESQLERDFYLILEHSDEIKIYQHQPVEINYKDKEGKSKKYYPDCFVEFHSSMRVLVEIKDLDSYMTRYHEFEEKWKAGEKYAKNSGFLFTVITEDQIRSARMQNIWLTLASSKVVLTNSQIEGLLRSVTKKGKQFNSLCYELSQNLGVELPKASQIICYAIYHGLVHIDRFSSEEITGQTIIRKLSNPNNSPFKSLFDEFEWDFVQPENTITSKTQNFTPEPITRKFNIEGPYVDEVKKRYQLVQEWLKIPSKRRSAKWRNDFCRKNDISEKSMYRWVSAFKKGGIEGLTPNHKKKGRNTTLSQRPMELMEVGRKKFYLKKNYTLNASYNELVKLCNKEGIYPPKEWQFRYYVYNTSTSSELAFHKRGKKFYKSNYTPSLKSFKNAILPMQVLQFDNTPLDIFPVDSEEREPMSTPYMTAAIDCYSRMITGYYISFTSSSSQSVLETLAQSILPKDEFTERHECQNPWLIEGFPVVMLVDNGMDYRAKEVKQFCKKYDIILEFAPLRTPRYKAYIESWFNNLRNAIREERVTGYRPLLKERIENPDLTPMKLAALTLPEIERWMASWIIDDYHFNNPYNDLLPAPYLRWDLAKNAQTEMILPMPRDSPRTDAERDLLLLFTLKRETRQLSRNGIRRNYIYYNTEDLAKLYRKIGINTVEILVDRKDIRNIWVIDPLTEKTLPVSMASGWAATILEIHGDVPISDHQWDYERKFMREDNSSQISQFTYKKKVAKLYREDLVKSGKKKTRKRRKQKEIQKNNRSKSVTNHLSQKPDPSVVEASEKQQSKKPKNIDWQKVKQMAKSGTDKMK